MTTPKKCAFFGPEDKCLSRSSPRRVCTLAIRSLPLTWCRAYQPETLEAES